MAIKHFSIRLDEEMLKKLHVIAKAEGRSLNSQILYWISWRITFFEAKHGKIKIEKETS